MSDVTRILSKIEAGDSQASAELLPLVYEELRKLAAARMANERADHTLQATALVHEAYLRLVDTERTRNWDSRSHFFLSAAEAMRRILIEYARMKQGKQRGGDLQRVDLEGSILADDLDPALVLDVSDALDRLAERDAQAVELVKLRCFAGLSINEAAELLGISRSTAYAYWAHAQALMGRLLA